MTYPVKIARLTVLREIKIHDGSRYRTHCECKCDCGTEFTTRKDRIFSSVVSSCGCLQRERVSEANRTHGMSNTLEYDTYMGMIDRCYNKNSSAYEAYGSRDITICDRWLGENGFANFYADMGPRPTTKHTIERINNDGNYEPDNCKWATRTEQNRNFSRNRVITYHGKAQCLSVWAEELGINRNRFYWLVRKGYSDAEALAILEQELQEKMPDASEGLLI